jgi:hypothetical protein
MRIANNRPLKELQAEFHSDFPYLDLYFYKNGASQPINELFEPAVRVGDVRDNGLEGEVVLNGSLSAKAIEQTVSEIFGLNIRVGFSKGFGNRYIQSNKPLAELNYRSMHLTEEVLIV